MKNRRFLSIITLLLMLTLLVGCGSADITGSWTYKGEVVEFLSDGTLFYDGCSDMHPPVYEITDEGYLKIGKYDYAWIAYEYTYFIIDINGNTLTLTDKTNADRVYVLERQ